MQEITISKKLKEYRYQNSITQRELASLLGVTTQTISKWENEKCYPDITLLPILADIIGCGVDDFFA